jgi:phage shock protein A
LLHRGLEKLQGELQELKDRCEDLRASKQEVVRELLLLQDQHQDQVRLIQLDLQDEATSREGMDRRLADLRTEVGNTSAEHTSGPITLGQQWVRLFLRWLAAFFTVPLYCFMLSFLCFGRSAYFMLT